MDHMTPLQYQGSEFFLEEEGRHAKKLTESTQSVFQLAFQKQGLKQLYHPLRKGDQSCTKYQKDGRR
jgi:hypothetical protein